MAKNITLQHKRSTVAGNKPAAGVLSARELAINFADKSLYFKTPGGQVVELARDVYKSATAPTAPTVGTVWFDTTNDIAKTWNGTKWENVTFSGSAVTSITSSVALTGSGTLADPLKFPTSYTISSGDTLIIDSLSVAGLTQSQLLRVEEISNTDGRFSVSSISSNAAGNTLLSIKYNDYPSSANGSTVTGLIDIGGIYVEIDVNIVYDLSKDAKINAPIDTKTTTSIWNGSQTNLTSTGSLLISLDGSTWSQGPITVKQGSTLYTKWSGSPGSNTGIDSAHGTTITGNIISSATGGTQTFSLTIDKLPDAFTFVDETGVEASTTRYSNEAKITGINSYAYVTSTGTGTYSVNGDDRGTIPAAVSAAHYVENNDSLQLAAVASANPGVSTNVPVSVQGVTDTYTITTNASGVATPTILTPVNGSNKLSFQSLTITSSAYSSTVGSHLQSDWEIYSDSLLTTLVTSSLASTTNLTSWTVTGLDYSKKYWVRVRYRSNDPIESQWSEITVFETKNPGYIAVAHATSPFISIYPWTGAFGAKVGDPATLPAGTGFGVTFSPSGSHIAVAHGTSPYISVYPWTGAFGAKVADPATLPTGAGYGVAFSPSGSHIAVAHWTSPRVSVYPWTGAFGAKVADPATLPVGNGNGVAFSPSGSHIAVGHATSPYISVYPWTGAFGAKVGNPATLPTGPGYGVAFSPDGSYIAVAHWTSPFISVYPWTGAFGAKVGNPATLPIGDGFGVAFSPSGSHIAVGHVTSPFISVYPWTGAFGAKVGNPATLPTGTGRGVAFSPSGSHIAVGHWTSPYISVYPWTGAFGAKVADPATLPTGNGYGVAFSPE